MARKAGRGYITRTRKYFNKKGELVVKTYYYTVSNTGKTTKAGKTTKKSYSKVGVVKPKEVLTTQEVMEYLDDNSVDYDTRQFIINDLNPDEDGDIKHFTVDQLDARVNDIKSDKLTTMFRNLGYSLNEFEDEYGISEAELRAGNFEKTGNSVKFTDKKGNVLLFHWDYNKGLIKV